VESMTWHAGRGQWRGSRFTLVELMAAMTVVVVMMMMLLRLVSAAQQCWELCESRSRIYENSRVLFDVLERDFRSAVSSTIPDKQIGFYVGDPFGASGMLRGLHACFVASSDPPVMGDSRLCEVSYRWDPEDPDHPYVLRRQAVSDRDASNWDFTGRPNGWYLNNVSNDDLAAFETVVDGVLEFTISCYDSANLALPANLDSLQIPNRVEVRAVLCDPYLVDAPSAVRFRTQRSFTKIFYLGDLQTN
jgi:hypothetical protein